MIPLRGNVTLSHLSSKRHCLIEFCVLIHSQDTRSCKSMCDLRMYIHTVHDSLSGNIDTITLIGIGNGSISHNLYLRNCMWAANQLKYIDIMPLPTSCFRVNSLLVRIVID